jgi:hypothetical protein
LVVDEQDHGRGIAVMGRWHGRDHG